MGLIRRLSGRGSENHDSPQDICNAVNAFMLVSRLPVEDAGMHLQQDNQLRILAYSFGAIEAVAKDSSYSPDAITEIAVAFLMLHSDLPQEDARAMSNVVTRLRQNPEVSRYLAEGALGIRQWLPAGAHEAAFRLVTLLKGNR